jgi:hypothetical protein
MSRTLLKSHFQVREGDLYDCGFDYLYDYDLWDVWKAAVKAPLGATALAGYAQELDMQLGTLPALGGKLRFTDNHDNQRCVCVPPKLPVGLYRIGKWPIKRHLRTTEPNQKS